MTNRIQIEHFQERANTIPIVDVRSPKEFEQGHIPGAINIPIFNNEERAIVGTKYKRMNREAAIIEGLEIAGPKMAGLVKQAKKVAGNKKELLIYCWRGGRRSESMAWLFNFSDIQTYVLEGGYKSYRKYILNCFTRQFHFIVLGGMTGSGKTDILIEIGELGNQIIDLENIANHKGSAFGALGQNEQPSNEQFENNLFYYLNKLNLKLPIWIEDESSTIGKIKIPDELFKQIRNKIVIKIEVPKNERIKRLVKEYSKFNKNDLNSCITKISKRLGGLNTKLAIEAIENGDFNRVADLSLTYYDKAYNFGLTKRDKKTTFSLALEEDDSNQNAIKVIEFAEKNKLIN